MSDPVVLIIKEWEGDPHPHPGDCPHPVEFRVLRKDGDLYWVVCDLCGLRGRDSRFVRGALGSFTSAVRRERLQRRADLEEERDRLERLMREPPPGTRVPRGRRV